ncbi:asparagine synthase (glutamine-hydrolysing) [Methylomarinovum caldicuralii]|uniref:asparagine synthase (glutamine-hydrolyzing) n=1 Tax=Methylomarinovum caldicuralii TaxID=438856 RepID=A0AAU9CC64_9GAMM|nr:asparagine synthase-related protein [Methylomarinovum caldicuralii]BCX82144.1 asparagine synthase (glutamine-hydrolysing) [Methylomarinovum caldicuralii]
MYDYAGWFGRHPDKHSPKDLLGAMLEPTAGSHVAPHVALAATSACLHGGEPIACLLSGRPRWQDAALVETAAREGNAVLFSRLWRKEGLEAFRHLGGGFAVAAWDRERQTGLLAVDRMGIHPLTYAEVPGGIVFAGDLQRLRRHPEISGEIDPQALFAYLYFHMIPAPLSVYRGVCKMLPGQYLLWGPSGTEQGFHWQPDFREDPRPEAELARDLRDRLRKGVAENLEQPEKTGAFLSGGLDSSTVTGLFSQLAPKEAAAFSIGFSAEGYDEMEYARASARHFGVPLHEYYVTPKDVTEAVPEIAAFYDEPFGNASAVPTYYCARLAREHGRTCLLAGDGGDELFAGNARYAKQKLFAYYDRIPPALRHILIEPLAALTAGVPLPGKLKSYVDQARIPMPMRMETYNFLHRTSLGDIFEAEFLAAVDTGWPIAHLREVYHRPQTSMLKRMLWLDWKITLADNDLRKVNRMCALADVDVRYPMLGDEVVALAARVPDCLLMRGLELRSFYRRAFRDFLAPETLKKSKHGFGLPFGLWLKTDTGLRDLAYDSLGSVHLRGIVRPDYLERLKQAHEQEHASYYGVMIWILMMWAQWSERHRS